MTDSGRTLRFGIFDHLDDSGLSRAEQLEQRLRLIEQYDRDGFYAYHLAEHHGTPLGIVGSPNLFLAAVAQRTQTLHFGALINVLPLYHPLRLVEEWCTLLDHLSGGRLEPGIGRGASPIEASFFGIDGDSTPERFAEAFDLITQAFAAEETFSYDGKYFTVSEMPLTARPLQHPHPPFWFGASRPDRAGWCAERAINVMSLVDAERTRLYHRRLPCTLRWHELGRDAASLPHLGVNRQHDRAGQATELEAMRVAELGVGQRNVVDAKVQGKLRRRQLHAGEYRLRRSRRRLRTPGLTRCATRPRSTALASTHIVLAGTELGDAHRLELGVPAGTMWSTPRCGAGRVAPRTLASTATSLADTELEAMRVAERVYPRFKESIDYLWVLRGMPRPPIYPEALSELIDRGSAFAQDARGRQAVHRRADRGGQHQLHDDGRRLRRHHIRGGHTNCVTARGRGDARLRGERKRGGKLSRAVRSFNDIEYRAAGDASLFLDIHRPGTDGDVPCVAYFHGGGWARGSRKDNVEERLEQVAAQGIAVYERELPLL